MSIKLNEKSQKIVEKYAKAKGIEMNDGADRLISIAEGRIKALGKYNAKAGEGKPAKPAKKAAAKGKVSSVAKKHPNDKPAKKPVKKTAVKTKVKAAAKKPPKAVEPEEVEETEEEETEAEETDEEAEEEEEDDSEEE